MRKIGFTLGLFLLISLFVAGTGNAGAAEKKTKNGAGAYAGEVLELDLKANRLVVAQNNTDLAMVFNTSRARAGFGYKRLGDVQVGDQVTVKFEGKSGIIYVLDIAKGEKPAAKPTPAKKPHP
jgi:hypothetical protein